MGYIEAFFILMFWSQFFISAAKTALCSAEVNEYVFAIL
jgi:hypothetical protein